jgi:hypothetical protein
MSHPSAAAQRDRIAAFWSWWSGGGAEAASRAIEAGDTDALLRLTTDRVDALDPRLAWEYGAGPDGSTSLAVTAGGDPEVRALARRWLLAAPRTDGWTFHDLRQPAPDGTVLTFGADRFADVDVVVATVRRGPVIDVEVHHPGFAAIPAEAAAQIAFLMLDNAVGEEAVELWVGRVEPVTVVPKDGVPLAHLPGVIDALRREHTDPDGGLSWLLLRGAGPTIARVRVRLSSVNDPSYDTHVAVQVPYEAREDGLPVSGKTDLLAAFEDHLIERLAGSGTVVAVETSRGIRTIHVYVDGTTPAVGMIEAATRGWPNGTVEIHARYDPAWADVQHFRVA